MKAEKVTPPPPDVLQKQLLERLITERVLMQFAKETGIRVDDVQVERTIQRIAQENKLSPEEFRKVLDREGIPYPKYREDIRREITVQRLREREVESRVIVTDAEVDNFLATVNAQVGGDVEYRLSHVLVLVPEQATPDADRRQAPARRGGAEADRDRDRFRPGRRRLLRRARCALGRHPGLAHARRGCRRSSPTRCAASSPARCPVCCARRRASTS